MGKTKRGKGTKIMAVAGGASLPISISVASASPHEVTLVQPTLESRFVKKDNDSAGVAKQYCGNIGKVENCQVGASLLMPLVMDTAFWAAGCLFQKNGSPISMPEGGRNANFPKIFNSKRSLSCLWSFFEKLFSKRQFRLDSW